MAGNERRLLDPQTGRPFPPVETPGYYPGYSTLAQQSFWDAGTRNVVQERMTQIPPIRFFTPGEAALMQLICDHLLPQDDRIEERKIPILPFIDERLASGRTAGYRFAGMPPDGAAYRLGLRAIELMASANHSLPFSRLSWHEQELLLQSIHDGTPLPGAEKIWATLPIERYCVLLVQDCVDVYYAHPWAWDEIGFGGPAYPRAYIRLENGEPEPWEVEEVRYEWRAPSASASDLQETIATHQKYAYTAQGGTH